MNENKINEYKLLAILIDEIILLKTKNAINEMVLEFLLQKNFPETFEALQVQLKAKTESLHAIHSQELMDLINVESDNISDDLKAMLSRLNM